MRTWRRYGVASTFYDELAHEGSNVMRNLMRKISAWRLRNGNYNFPVEHKLFHLYVKLTKQTKEDVLQNAKLDATSGVTPNAPA